MKTTEQAIASANTSRYYVRSYDAAMKSPLDGELFATLEKQESYFARKLAESKQSLRDNLFGARAVLAIELRALKGDDRTEVEIAIAGIDSELEGLKNAK
jgi:hypothetical protein